MIGLEKNSWILVLTHGLHYSGRLSDSDGCYLYLEEASMITETGDLSQPGRTWTQGERLAAPGTVVIPIGAVQCMIPRP